jgi:hypothetical protein
MGGLGIVAVAWISLQAWWRIPIRFDWMSDTPAVLQTPHGDLSVKRMIGFSRRRRPEGWFVGAIQLKRATPPQPSAAESETQ